MEPGFYAITAIEAAVGSGVTGTHFVSMEGVLKRDNTDFAYTVANEYVAGRLAAALGIPVPPGTVVQLDDGSMGYTMMKFGLKGDSPPPCDVADFVAARPHLAAGVVLFDSWVLNADRHSGNMAWYPAPKSAASFFDHGHALFGGVHAGEGLARINSHQMDSFLGHGKVIGELTTSEDLEYWIEAIQAIRDHVIKEACASLLGLGLTTKDERDRLQEILIVRRNALRAHVLASRAAFSSIDDGDWGLT